MCKSIVDKLDAAMGELYGIDVSDERIDCAIACLGEEVLGNLIAYLEDREYGCDEDDE